MHDYIYRVYYELLMMRHYDAMESEIQNLNDQECFFFKSFMQYILHYNVIQKLRLGKNDVTT